ncbi:SDR family NAD(P)-dependent oxidoreductase [Bosea sp. 124]|uniref:SDR family NAD(P)-dependent oxidoreductase n=1 Tax=Bosea sp. 124 TaxID=2135642 RepID=UPI000D3B2DF1|nr:SDR family NAD(P)-dependent oxidoreductase [Bosea sp. 124]PTM43361.1 3-oxoacyl-[acyl-carrier protein] reductase [Bosea sp. 124]
MIDFSGKVLLLTGANGAISRAVARLFFRHGALCVLTDLDEDGVKGFARELDPDVVRILALRQDAAVAEDAERAVDAAVEKFGRIDALVTAAGLYRDRLVSEMSEAEWRQSIAINLDGVFHSCRAAIPHLAEGSAIVNIASMAGHRGSYAHAHYAAAKGGVLSLTRSLALELAPRTRVNAVSPGLIEGPMVQPLIAKKPELIPNTPMKRLGTPEEVAGVVAFLCSDLARFVTGETIHVNGGLHIAS